MGSKSEIEKLLSGKLIYRVFGASGELTTELHSYSDSNNEVVLRIVLSFDKGYKIGEKYFGSDVISRTEYEERRTLFPDMPAADFSVVDYSAEALSRKRAGAETAAARVGTNSNQLTTADLFCANLLERGYCADATDWILKEGRTLGELDQTESRKLVAQLNGLGAIRLFVCEIDPYEEGSANTEHLVVELPKESDMRATLLQELSRLAEERGYDGYGDAGQRYAYLRLD